MSDTPIYDVEQDRYARSTTGELASLGVSPCVAVILIFTDNKVIVEHYSEGSLGKSSDEEKAMQLFGEVAGHIRKHKGDATLR